MMKLFFIAMALPVMASKCSKSASKDRYLEGKVIRTSCANVVMQVLNNDTIGEDGWKDMTNNNTVYDNVFVINNSCTYGEKLSKGKTIRFKIDPAAKNECMYCMMYDAPPKANYLISDVSVVEAH